MFLNDCLRTLELLHCEWPAQNCVYNLLLITLLLTKERSQSVPLYKHASLDGKVWTKHLAVSFSKTAVQRFATVQIKPWVRTRVALLTSLVLMGGASDLLATGQLEVSQSTILSADVWRLCRKQKTKNGNCHIFYSMRIWVDGQISHQWKRFPLCLVNAHLREGQI